MMAKGLQRIRKIERACARSLKFAEAGIDKAGILLWRQWRIILHRQQKELVQKWDQLLFGSMDDAWI